MLRSNGSVPDDETARKHITAGAKKVVMADPSKDTTPMFVKGDFDKYAGQDIVSNASCTPHQLPGPAGQAINDNFGIIEA
ncbi:hypothetical protein ACNKHU_08695 [Shigella flexneri]